MENEKKLNIIGIVIKILIIAPALITGLMVMGSGVNAESEDLAKAEFMDSFAFSAVFNISFITIIAAVILVLGFFGALLASRPMAAIKSVLGIIVAGLFFFIMYAIGTSDTSDSLQLGGGISVEQSVVNFTHAGVITALIGIVIGAVLALGMGYVLKLVRKN